MLCVATLDIILHPKPEMPGLRPTLYFKCQCLEFHMKELRITL